MTFDEWLVKKREQLKKDKQYETKLKELELMDRIPPHTKAEREAAFRQYVCF